MPDAVPAAAVTGAGRGLGLALVRRLVGAGASGSPAHGGPKGTADPPRGAAGEDGHRQRSRGDVVGIDATTIALEPDVRWRQHDVRDPAIVGALAGVHTLVHLDSDVSVEANPRERSEHNVRGTQTVLTAAAAAGVRRVVLLTSAMVYGARPDNPVPLPEEAPLRAQPDGALVGDWLEIEELARSAERVHPGLRVTVVRPAALVGPGVDSLFTRHFEAPRLLVVSATTPAWQFCHVDDLVRALELIVARQLDGPLTVGCEGWLEQSRVERISGMRRIELPLTLAMGTAERLHRLGVTPAPASDLQYVMYPWVVGSQRLRAAGWRPVYDNETALEALLEQVSGHHAVAARRVTRRDATLGAAGAAVAVVGTAAILRRARRRI